MISRRYLVYDVFTGTPLTGNPLAVVLDSDGLDDVAMQAIAREFNLSETVFVSAATSAAHAARVRIFTPRYELPFAGHPTVGTAVALCELEQPERMVDTRLMVLEEAIGDVRCVITPGKGALFAEFDLPKGCEQLDAKLDVEAIAASLGLGPHEIGFENHKPGIFSAGVPFVTVPVANLKAIGKVLFDPAGWLELAPKSDNGAPACAYLYCRETINHEASFHARAFDPGPPAWEDPATGSAAAAFAGAIMRFDAPLDGRRRYWIEQGHEMGRPSHIRLEIDVEAGRMKAARIGGQAVKIAEGVITA